MRRYDINEYIIGCKVLAEIYDKSAECLLTGPCPSDTTTALLFVLRLLPFRESRPAPSKEKQT